MSITLPPGSEATTESLAAIAADIVTARAVFIANATVLINNAVNLGFFKVEPFLTPFVSHEFVITYFTAMGYNVLFPIIPRGPFNPAFVPGFPEVLPPGYHDWGGPCWEGQGPPRIRISWSQPTTQYYLLLESGEPFLLENGVDGILLENSI